jgi:hypothetical protein
MKADSKESQSVKSAKSAVKRWRSASSRERKLGRLLAAYFDLLNAGTAPSPKNYSQAYPEIADELREECETAVWIKQALNLRPRPLDPEVSQRMLRRVLMPRLKKLAERLHQRAEELKDQTQVPLHERPDLILLLLHLSSRKLAAEDGRRTTNDGRRTTNDGITGMVRMMKLLFLAQQTTAVAKGLTRGYEFMPDRFGPSTPEVYDDLQTLIWADLIQRTEFDTEGLPVVNRNDYGQMQETSFSSANAHFQLTPEGEVFAERLVRHLEQNQPELLKQLTALKQRLDRMSWQRIVVQVYADYPEYAVESELLPQIRKTQTEQQPE